MPASNYPIRRPSLHHAMPRGDSQTVAHESAPLDRLPTPRGRRQRISGRPNGNSASSHKTTGGRENPKFRELTYDASALEPKILGG
jgi:hypothetical protein